MANAQRRAAWDPPVEAQDGYLAFLAARDRLRARSQPRFAVLLRLAASGYGGRRGTSPSGYVRELASASMKAYVVACEVSAEQLSGLERQRLRFHGELPEWFMPAVEAAAKQLRADNPEW